MDTEKEREGERDRNKMKIGKKKIFLCSQLLTAYVDFTIEVNSAKSSQLRFLFFLQQNVKPILKRKKIF